MKKNVHYSDDFNLNFEDIFYKRAVGCLNVYLKLVICKFYKPKNLKR